MSVPGLLTWVIPRVIAGPGTGPGYPFQTLGVSPLYERLRSLFQPQVSSVRGTRRLSRQREDSYVSLFRRLFPSSKWCY